MQIYPFFRTPRLCAWRKDVRRETPFPRRSVGYSVDHISNFLVNTSSTWANPVSQSSDMNSSPLVLWRTLADFDSTPMSALFAVKDDSVRLLFAFQVYGNATRNGEIVFL